MGDDASQALAKKYASAKRELYVRELAESYARVTAVGASITGAKVLAP